VCVSWSVNGVDGCVVVVFFLNKEASVEASVCGCVCVCVCLCVEGKVKVKGILSRMQARMMNENPYLFHAASPLCGGAERRKLYI
jgi:hypothetical protein